MNDRAMSKTGLSYAQVDEILKIIEEFPAAEIRFEYQDLKLYVRRSNSEHASAPGERAVAPVIAPPVEAPAESAPAKTKPRKTKATERAGLVAVKAPMMGVFYRAPAPGAEPFVTVGQEISPGTDLCIIEVMKVMNLIKAPCAGVIAEIDAENAAMVELDQAVIWIRP
jgi:acetyl-CoA carboxylase biotin carboxyl carrier protein